ncbi:type II toxin-antitoxin system Phd/YefM family antitoxin [Chloroflexi bacterium TSY]|nr:type II toxin-antitoxin system Phd/YefM family antitoxin [Chloroflexi bacterium TSY]
MQTAPISDVHLNQKTLLKRLIDNPIVLMSRSQPAAVLVSVEEWNRTAMAMEIMLELIQNERPWFTLPLYTLEDIRHEKENVDAALAMDNQQTV